MDSDKPDDGSNWLSWIFPLFGVLIALGIAWGIGWLQARETYNRQQLLSAYQRQAFEDVKKLCSNKISDDYAECVAEKISLSYQNTHDELDLSAQQRAASSALISAITAIVTLAISWVGLWYIKRTLDANWRAVNVASQATQASLHANEIAGASARAWLSVKIVSNGEMDICTTLEEGNGFYTKLSVVVKNHGASPAHDVRLFAAFVQPDIGDKLVDLMRPLCDEWRERMNAIPYSGGPAIYPGEDETISNEIVITDFAIEQFLAKIKKGYIYPVLVGCISYRTDHSAGVRQTKFQVYYSSGTDLPIYPSSQEWWKSVRFSPPYHILSD